MIVFGNRVLCLVVLFLLQSAGWMAMAQEKPAVSVEIKNHLVFDGTVVKPKMLTYTKSKNLCKDKGGYLLSGYTKALRTDITGIIRGMNALTKSFIIGADMTYSAKTEPDPTKRCVYSAPSLNCIIKWNQGLWANALGDGKGGVGFYQGFGPSVKGSDLINGYDVLVESVNTNDDNIYILRTRDTGDNFVFDITSFDKNKHGLTRENGLIVCEVQGLIITTPTDAPTAPTEAPTAPTEAPTGPTDAPTAPTEAPTAPTEAPTAPTEAPTAPTDAPTAPTDAPTAPTEAPTTTTEAPTAPTDAPTGPTEAPTAPTEAPTTKTDGLTNTTNKSQGTGSEVSSSPEKLDDDSGWSNGLIAAVVILPILLAILAIVLCLYCCGYICRRKADDRQVTEDSKAMIHTDGEEGVMHRDPQNPNMDTALGNRTNPLLGEDGQERREKI